MNAHNINSPQRPPSRTTEIRGEPTRLAASKPSAQPAERRIPRALREDTRAMAMIGDPAFIRLPAPGTRDSWTGLSRGTLCELVVACAANDFKPPVRSVVLKKKGAVRGIRLIDLPSLLAHLNRLADDANFDAHGNDDVVDFIERDPLVK